MRVRSAEAPNLPAWQRVDSEWVEVPDRDVPTVAYFAGGVVALDTLTPQARDLWRQHLGRRYGRDDYL